MTQKRQPEGIPIGGQYAATAHAEGTLTLQAAHRAPARPELAGYDIPAPLEGQTFLDGTPITASTFEEAYEEFLRPLEEYEAEHGKWQTTRAPSESTLLELAGLRSANMGSVRGVFLEADEKTGEPLVEVHTRNPEYCLRNDCDGTCHACLEDNIHTLPGFVRSTTEDGDVSHFFRPSDPAAAQPYLADKKTREMLNHRRYARQGLASGKMPPWAILSPVRSGEERSRLGSSLSYARSMAARKSGDGRYARELLDLLKTGASLRKDTRYAGALLDTAGYEIYGEALKKHTAEAARLRSAGSTLAEERRLPLPPAIAALAAAEADRIDQSIVKEDTRVQDARARLDKSKRSIQRWAEHLLLEEAKLEAEVRAAEAEIAAFDWSFSWPGDPKDCPPAPAVNGE